MIENIAHQSLTADLRDLSQMVYLILLEYDEDRLQDLWEHEQMRFFIARIITNQYRSSNSPFHTQFRKFRQMIDEEVSLSVAGDANNVDFDIFSSTKVTKR